MTFHPEPASSRDLLHNFALGELYATPLDVGVWALLPPAGTQNHAPQLCWIEDDQLACVWMAGLQEGTEGMSIYGSVLKQGKSRWSKPKLLSQDPLRSEQNPILFVTSDRRLHLIHTAQEPRAENDDSWQREGSSFSKQWTALLRHQSTSGWGKRWTKATNLIEERAFCRHPPVPSPGGRLLLPVYRSLEEGGAFGNDYSLVLSLDSSGNYTGPTAEVPHSVGRVHGSVVLSANGETLLQFFRSRLADFVYRSVGSLDGKDWSSPEATSLPNNNSSIQAVRLKGGLLALVFNRFGLEPEETRKWGEAVWPRVRSPLTIAISHDDGLHWPWIRDIDTAQGFCGEANWQLNAQLAYPSIVEGLPGELHIAYSWGNRAAIRYLCINIKDVIG